MVNFIDFFSKNQLLVLLIAYIVFLFLIFFFLCFIDYAIKVVSSPRLFPSTLHALSHQHPTHLLQVMSMGRTYKFFGFSISYIILNLPLSIFYLPFMLLILCTFSPILPPPLR